MINLELLRCYCYRVLSVGWRCGPTRFRLSLNALANWACSTGLSFWAASIVDDVESLISDARVFVMPSRLESCGLPYYESMAVGRPPIDVFHGIDSMNLWSLRKLGSFGPARRLVKQLFALYFRTGVVRTIALGPLKGMSWECHEAQQFWMPLGVYETETTRWLRQELAPGLTFLDIGANAGYFALVGSREVGDAGRVVAFEPSPLFANMVQRNLELNRLNNVYLEPVALSDSIGTAEFVIESVGANSHFAETRLQHAPSSPDEVIEVSVTTLDAYVSEHSLVPDVIKIDVEGAERMVLEGATDVLSEYRPMIITSCHSAALKRACGERLEQFGYRVSSLDGFDHELIGEPN